MRDPYRASSQKDTDRRAREWLDKLDQTARVGRKHHIVPSWVLSGFSNSKDQLWVRDRATGEGTLRSVDDLAVKNFYTTIDHDGQPNSAMEDLLGVIENAAQQAIQEETKGLGFRKPHKIEGELRLAIDSFVGMQWVRGMRTRRGLEHMADWYMKATNQHRLSQGDLKELEFVPHQNEHIKMMGDLAENVCDHLITRSVAVLILDAPLLITCDEPVILGRPESSRHIPEKAMTEYPDVVGEDPKRIVQFTTGETTGLADADDIAFPIAPDRLIYYGRIAEQLPSVVNVRGREAGDLVRNVNREIIASAIDWVAAHPQHPSFQRMALPKPKRIIGVIDGGSAMSEAINSSTRRRPERFRMPDEADLEYLAKHRPEAHGA